MANEKSDKRAAQKQAFMERAVLAIIPVMAAEELDDDKIVAGTCLLAARLTDEMYPPEPDQEKYEAAPATNSVAS